MQKAFAGGAVPTTLEISIDEVTLVLIGQNFQNWPDGLQGPFNVTLGRDTASEEKCLAESLTGTTLTLSQRGYDGTIARPHSASTTIEHGWFGVDASDSNTHVNAVGSVHGLSLTDGNVVGTDSDDTLVNKRMSGLANTFTDIQPSSIPTTTAEIAGLHNEDTNLQGQINTETGNRVLGDANVTTAFQAADTAHVNAADPHTQYLTQSAADARYDALNAASAGDSAHVALADPHTQYLTDAGEAALNRVTADVTGVKVARGSFTFTVVAGTAVGSGQGPQIVAFPAGLFSAAPVVVCSPVSAPAGSGILTTRAINATAVQVSMYVYNVGSGNTVAGTIVIGWVAVGV